MKDAVAEILRAYVEPGERVLAAVSGGTDSVALLFLLAETAPLIGFRLAVAHLNHGIRGDEARQDAEFVAELARRLGLPLVTGYDDVPRLFTGRSLEDAAREVRYRFLERAADNFSARWIALGHQREDQAETVLWRFLRGAGVEGLSGMAVRRRRFLRPLLGFSRAELETFLRSRGLTAREDSTNAGLQHFRNRLRLELVPLLRAEYNPRLIGALDELAERMRADGELLAEITRRGWSEFVREDGGGFLLLGAAWNEPVGLRRRLLLAMFRRLGADPGFRTVERCLATWPDGPVRQDAGGGLVLRRDERGLWLGHGSTPEFATTLPVPGFVRLPGGILEAEVRVPGELGPGEAAFHWEGEPLRVRGLRAGDRIRPRGFPHRRKASDLLREAGVPPWRRASVPVVFAGERLLWIVGLRPGEEPPAPGEPGLVLRWKPYVSH